MAREDTTADDLEKLAKTLSSASTSIELMVQQIRENGVPSVRLHLAMLTKRLLPQVEHWVDIAQLNVRDDVRSYLAGVESPSAAQHRYNQNRKRAGAKKADPPAKRVSRPSKKTT